MTKNSNSKSTPATDAKPVRVGGLATLATRMFASGRTASAVSAKFVYALTSAETFGKRGILVPTDGPDHLVRLTTGKKPVGVIGTDAVIRKAGDVSTYLGVSPAEVTRLGRLGYLVTVHGFTPDHAAYGRVKRHLVDAPVVETFKAITDETPDAVGVIVAAVDAHLASVKAGASVGGSTPAAQVAGEGGDETPDAGGTGDGGMTAPTPIVPNSVTGMIDLLGVLAARLADTEVTAENGRRLAEHLEVLATVKVKASTRKTTTRKAS